MQNDRFLRHALVYGLGSLLLHAASVVLLPLYTRWLSPEEFGMLEVFNRVGEVLGICLMLGGLRQATVVLHGQSHSAAERRRIAGTAVAVVAAAVLLGALLSLTVLAGRAWGLGLGDPLLLVLAVVAFLLENSATALLALTQVRVQSVFFVAVSLGQLLVRVAFCLVFAGWLGWGVAGVVTAALLTGALSAAVVAGRELWPWPPPLDLGMAREMVRFSLPLVPCGLCFFLLNNGDRFFLLPLAGERAVGLYAFGYKLATAVALFSRAPLMMVWNPQTYELGHLPEAPAIFARAFTRILAAYAFVGLGLCLLVEEAIAVVGGPAFAESAVVIAPVVLAYFFLTMADLADAAFYLRRRSGLKTCVALPSSALVMVLYALLIPHWGATGAAYATLAGFACHALATWLVARRVFPLRWELGRVSGLLALAVGLWLAAGLLPEGAWVVPGKVVLWALWPALLWATGLVTPAEKQLVRSALRAVASFASRLSGRRQGPAAAGGR
jgi:O-antigen/teichoic acid export membrane protein